MRALATLAFVTLLIWADAALACSCRRPSAQELIESSESVFTGIAQKTVRPEDGESQTSFRVVTAYKGVKRGETVVAHHGDGTGTRCGIKFEPGKSYTLSTYRREDDKRLFTGRCGVYVMTTPAGKEVLRILQTKSNAAAMK